MLFTRKCPEKISGTASGWVGLTNRSAWDRPPWRWHRAGKHAHGEHIWNSAEVGKWRTHIVELPTYSIMICHADLFLWFCVWTSSGFCGCLVAGNQNFRVFLNPWWLWDHLAASRGFCWGLHMGAPVVGTMLIRKILLCTSVYRHMSHTYNTARYVVFFPSWSLIARRWIPTLSWYPPLLLIFDVWG
jgi:hypothetical protein